MAGRRGPQAGHGPWSSIRHSGNCSRCGLHQKAKRMHQKLRHPGLSFSPSQQSIHLDHRHTRPTPRASRYAPATTSSRRSDTNDPTTPKAAREVQSVTSPGTHRPCVARAAAAAWRAAPGLAWLVLMAVGCWLLVPREEVGLKQSPLACVTHCRHTHEGIKPRRNPPKLHHFSTSRVLVAMAITLSLSALAAYLVSPWGSSPVSSLLGCRSHPQPQRHLPFVHRHRPRIHPRLRSRHDLRIPARTATPSKGDFVLVLPRLRLKNVKPKELGADLASKAPDFTLGSLPWVLV